MEKLERIIVAEPSEEAAQTVAEKLDRLAHVVEVTHRGYDAIARVKDLEPEMLVLSLEIGEPEASDVLSTIRKAGIDCFVVATYRELSVQGMKKLGKFGVGEFVALPVDATSIYRAASTFFGRPFRRHTRHQVTLPVNRVDGAHVGKTLDLSEGGMQVSLEREVAAGTSQLWEVALDDGGEKPLRVRCAVLGTDVIEGKATAARVEFEKLVGPDLARLSRFLESRSAGSV